MIETTIRIFLTLWVLVPASLVVGLIIREYADNTDSMADLLVAWLTITFVIMVVSVIWLVPLP